MSGPTREEAIEWGRQVGLLPDNSHPAPETRSMRMREDRIFALVRTAFAAGSRSGEDARDAARKNAIAAMRALVTGLEATYWSSWQSTAHFYAEYEQAREALGQLDAAMGGNDA